MHKGGTETVTKGNPKEGHAGVKFLGHSVHPMAIVFPLGLLSAAVIFEIIYYIVDDPTFAVVAHWMTVAGIIGGAFAAFFGWIDWLAIEDDTRAKKVGLAHGVVNSIVLTSFAASLYFRYGSESEPPVIAFVFALLGAGLALVGGWLGGELVERLGIGVHYGANHNAPSSLNTSDATRSTAAER